MNTLRRKGASRIADIPPYLLEALNQGREETLTLVEWLAIDMPTLMDNIAHQIGLEDRAADLVASAQALAGDGVAKRMRGIGEALYRATLGLPTAESVFESLADRKSVV